MDPEQVKKRQTLRVLFSEAMMVLSVVAIMTVLIMITSGYWINQNFEVERRGMLEVLSSPTGADIVVDGETAWMAKTNSSRILSKGEHTVTISKEGYGDWTKKVTIEEGLMYRVPYVRLFPNERELEKVGETSARLSSVSPDRSLMLLINNSTTWKMLHLNDDKISAADFDVSKVFDKIGGVEAMAGIAGIDWNKDGNRVLLKVVWNEKDEWLLLDLKNAEKSVSLTEVFGMNFDTVKFFDKTGDDLLVVESGELRKLDVSEQSISKILASNVTNFNTYDESIVYVADGKVSVLRKFDSEAIDLLDVQGDRIFAALTRSYRDNYLTAVADGVLSLYKGQLPRSKDDDSFEQVFSVEIGLLPERIKIGADGDFVIMSNGKNIVTLDMESESVSRFEIEDGKVGWLDDYLLYVVDGDGDMIAYDYDGLNRRELSKNASQRLSATVSEDNRWLYYFSDGWLVRESLILK
ncbi:PEGA domain-containing protein [Candidatus Saccharibacteria bacterium]|nr:PEGA domain-containing protein [Candidatus Saccharibacteria bacterium]